LANHPKVSAQKRARERARQERQKEKAARREDARDRKTVTPRGPGGEDPDIAGIVPGPQASPWGDDEPWGEDEESDEDEDDKDESTA
jgi:hypothetical protein